MTLKIPLYLSVSQPAMNPRQAQDQFSHRQYKRIGPKISCFISGACVTATVTCNNGHTLPWCSSETIATPRRPVKVINLLLVLHTFLSGISFEKAQVGCFSQILSLMVFCLIFQGDVQEDKSALHLTHFILPLSEKSGIPRSSSNVGQATGKSF